MGYKKTLEMLKKIRIFTMTGLLMPQEAEVMTNAYRKGDVSKISDFCRRLDIPYEYEPIIQEIKVLLTER